MVLSGQLTVLAELLRDSLPAGLAAMDNWRLSFLLAVAPAPLMILLIGTVKIVYSMQRSVTGGAVEAHHVTLRDHMRNHKRTLYSFFIAMGMATFAFGAVGAWLPVILIRMFGETPATIGGALGTISIIGMFTGFVFSALVLKWLQQRYGQVIEVRAMWTAGILSCFTSAALSMADSAQHIYMIQSVQVICLTAANMLFPTVLQNLAPTALRARVIAIMTTINVALGAAAAPTVGFVSDRMQGSSGDLLMAASGTAVCGLLISVALFRYCERGYVQTVEEIARLDPDNKDGSEAKQAAA
jgi:hypothetical protein